MKTRRTLLASLGSAMTLVLVIVAWVAFAPTKLGGQVSYVIVSGNSMEPGMHRGDLAVVRRSHSYTEGDVVTYRHPEIGPVIHRIIGREGERFVFKGDHNDFIDGHRPLESELIGELWFRVPSAGRLMRPLQEQKYAAVLIVLALAGLGGGAGVAASRKRSPEREGAPPQAAHTGGTVMQSITRNWEDGLATLGAAAFAFLVLALVSFGRPVTREVPDNVTYTQSGEFTYSAQAMNGALYDSAAATTGDPVYRRQSDRVDVSFHYRFTSKRPAEVSGSQRLVAELGDDSGWKRTFELQPEVSFSGGEFTAAGAFSLQEIGAAIEQLENETGVHNQSYTVSVVPQVSIAGSMAGRTFEDTFDPAMEFKLDPFQLSLLKDSNNGKDTLAPSAEGLSEGKRSETNTVNLLFFELGVATGRWVSLLGLGLVMAAAGVFILGAIRRMGPAGDSPQSVQAKYGLPVITVRSAPAPKANAVIDVASVDDLARVAEREGSVILQEMRPGYHCYFVQAGSVVYRFQVLGTPSRNFRGAEAA
ncbi:MAG: signal peptidase I [Dehalococcoidia bacterium]|nr:signal peptidase I [Dehalococcoidia bacterium]